jgi:pheromone shutdown-related protein TraB
MDNVKIIGTSHIAQGSVDEIKAAVTAWKPDIVAIELDLQRASALMAEEKSKVSLAMILKIGVKGYLFAKIGQFVQQKLGKVVGVSPGSEMKAAMELTRKEKLEIAFIDQPIQITLKKFSKYLTWKEKFRFVYDMLKGLLFPKKQIKALGLDQFDLTKVPGKEVIKKMMNMMKKTYPNVYRALVSDRNKYMVKNIVKLLRKNPGKKILVVVGAGHQEGMEKLLLKVEVV